MTAANKHQLVKLADLMSENPEFAKKFKKEQKQEANEFWLRTGKLLNNLGPPVKSLQEWKKVWIDQKRYARKKAEGNLHKCTRLEKQILKLISSEESNGFERTSRESSFGLIIKDESSTNQSEEEICEVPSVEFFGHEEDAETQPTSPKRPCKSNSEKAALDDKEQHSHCSGIFQSEALNLFKKISETLEQISCNQHNLLKETKRHSAEMERLKILEIETKVKLWARRNFE